MEGSCPCGHEPTGSIVPVRAKVVFVTGAKNKMRLEKNSNRRAFRDQKARHPEP